MVSKRREFILNVIFLVVVIAVITYCVATADAGQSGDNRQYEDARRRMKANLYQAEQLKKAQAAKVVEPVQLVVSWTEDKPPVAADPMGNRCYMITSESCGPCRQSKGQSPNLIGDGKVVQTIDIEARPNYARELGIRHAPSIPTWVVINSDGREILRTTGFQSNSKLTSFLSRNNIGVNMVTASDPMAVATIHAEPTSSAIVAAFVEHLSRSQNGGDFPVGGLFDRDLSVPEQVPQILAILMSGEPLFIEEAGLKVSWPGSGRQIEFVSHEELRLNPPVSVRLQKWRMAVTTTLSGFQVTEEGRTIRFILKGPDFTVRFIP